MCEEIIGQQGQHAVQLSKAFTLPGSQSLRSQNPSHQNQVEGLTISAAMNTAAAEEEGGAPIGNRHIKKRALRNKSLSVSFDEKDLKDFVGGFHKRKKKRRKEALQQQEEAGRRKRIELRKKRKLEREFVQFGGAQPDSGTDAAKLDEEDELDEDTEPVASVSGTMMYDNDDVQVIVTTSEISRNEVFPVNKPEEGRAPSTQGSEMGKEKTHVIRKKQVKKAQTKRSRPKIQRKRDKRKAAIKNTKH